MKVSFEIFNQDDAADAVGMLLALEDVFKLISGDLVAQRPTAANPPDTVTASKAPAVVPTTAEQPAAPKRGRPKKADNGTSMSSAPVAAPNGTEPASPPNGHDITQPDLFPDEDIETARERLRSVAQEKGVAWLRPQLETRGAKRLSDLSDSQVREFLRDNA